MHESPESRATLPPNDGAHQGRLSVEDLTRHLWQAVEILRGSPASPAEVKVHIAALLLLKRFSDQFDEFREFLREVGADPENPDEYPYFVPGVARWSRLQPATGEALNHAMVALEAANPQLRGVFDPGALRLFRGIQGHILNHLIEHFSKLDLRDSRLRAPGDPGRALQAVASRLDGAGPVNDGTPAAVARLLVDILQPQPGMRICDPACGSGGLLIACAESVERHGGDPRSLVLHGQELNSVAWAQGRMNMILCGLPEACIERGHTIQDPKFVVQDGLTCYDLVLSNPPINVPDWGREVAERDPFQRFRFGIPPNSRGDYAFLQHMISVLSPRGRMAALVPQAALAREGVESLIRKQMVESDLIEAVVSLPLGTLPGVQAAPAVLVVNRAKPSSQRGHVFFVDATKQPNDRKRSEGAALIEVFEEIAATVQEFREEDGRSRRVPLDEVARHDYSLYFDVYLSAPESGERLGALAEVFQGKGRASPERGGSELPVLQGRDLGVRGLSLGDLATWPAPVDPSRAVLAQVGDILVQRIGQNAKAMLVGRDLAGAMVSNTVYVVRLREENRAKAAYLVGFLSSPTGQRRLARLQAAAVIPTLSLRGLRNLTVTLPDSRSLELYERFRAVEDDLLDRVQKTLEIRSKFFEAQDAELVEAEIRRLSLEAELLRESVARADDPEFQIRSFSPHMVAYGYSRLGSIFDDEKLYREQFGVLEVFLTFLASIGLALAASVGTAEDMEAHGLGRDELVKLWRQGVPSGLWVDLCRRAVKLLRARASHAAGATFVAMWTPRLERTLGSLLDMRNANAHHRGPRTKRELRGSIERVEDLLRETFREALLLARHPIRLVESLFVPWRTSEVMLKTLVYRGDHPSLKREEIRHHAALPQGHLYLEVEPGSWLSLYPLLSVEELGSERCTYAIARLDERRRSATLKGLEQSQNASPEHTAHVGEDLCAWLDDVFGPRAAEGP